MKSAAMQITVRSNRAALICSAAVLVALGRSKQAWADPGMTDLAIGGIATSTGTDYGGTPDKGNDGNRDGNFGDGSVFYENSPNNDGTDTNPNTTYYYQVNLGQNDYINRVQFLPRTDVDQNVFGNFNISIYPNNGSGQPAATPSFSQNYNSTYFGDSFATLDPGAAAPGGAYGQFVRITRLDNNYWLTFAEMEVIGAPTPLKYTVSNDIALGKPVTTSSPPGYGAFISSGNDGDINGDFNAPDRPVYHSSNHSVGEYWQVDLGANTPLSYAELFARTVTNTTSQFDVEVFDSSMNLVDSVIVNNSDPQGTTPGYDHEIDLNGITGEFIRVATTTDSYLSFAELEAFAAVVVPTLTWNNSGGTPMGDGLTWDTTSLNFNNGTAPAAYNNTSNTNSGDNVIFNDSNNGNYNVSISGVVSPSSTTFNNSKGDYSVFGANGSSGIAGPGSLTKYGSGTVMLAGSNSYTGGTFVNAGTLTFASGTAYPANTSLNIASGALVTIANHSTNATYVPIVSVLNNSGTIDIANNALVVHNGSIGAITAQVALAYNHGAWNGTNSSSGIITSSLAANDICHLTAVGVATGLTGFEGSTVLPTDVLVKYTYYGDANLDGHVDGSDYSLIDNGYLSRLTGWNNGDFNYDGVVDGSDYTLIDNAFNTQGAAIAAQLASLTAQVAGGEASSAVPEPTTLGLLGIGIIGLLGRRRRHS